MAGAHKNKHPSQERADTPQGTTLREKAASKLKGPGANPSMLGDPVSLKAESSDKVPAPSEAGAHGSPQHQGQKSQREDTKLKESLAEKKDGRDPTRIGEAIHITKEQAGKSKSKL